MAEHTYRFELRRGGEVVATGQFSRSEPLAIGDEVEIIGVRAVVRRLDAVIGAPASRLVAEEFGSGDD